MARGRPKTVIDSVESKSQIDAAIDRLEKLFGKNIIIRVDVANPQKVDFIPTGSLALDAALGVGGIPRGRITEIYGPEMSGKTTLCQHIIAEAQKMGGVAAFIDVENTMDLSYAQKCGVDISRDAFLVSQPESGEAALQVAETLINSGAVTVVVVDSVASLVPQAEIDGEIGQSYIALQARLMGQALRKLTGAVNRSNTALIFTNQIRYKIGGYGNPEVTPGGVSLKFFASVRLDMRKKEEIKIGTEQTGNRIKVRVVKNKVASPYRVAEFDITYGKGISREGDLLDMGVAIGIIEQSGTWYNYCGQRVGQGREQSKKYLQDTPVLASEIEGMVRGKINSVQLPVEVDDEFE